MVEPGAQHGRSGQHLLSGLLAALCLLGASTAGAQPSEITISFFAPSVYFEDSVARAGFINSVASHVADEVGVEVRGVNISSSSDLDDADFAIVDGIYYAGSQDGDAVGSAEGSEGKAESLALIVGSSGPSRLADLRGASLILPRVGSRLEDFVTGSILHGEISAEDFFDEIQYTSNIESALSAVASGRADATVAFESYGGRSGLSVVDSYDEAPMPIVVQYNDSLDSDFAEQVADAIRGARASGEISGFGSFDSGAVSSFRRRASPDRSSRTPLMTRARGVTIEPGELSLPERSESLSLNTPIDLFEIPSLEEQ